MSQVYNLFLIFCVLKQFRTSNSFYYSNFGEGCFHFLFSKRLCKDFILHNNCINIRYEHDLYPSNISRVEAGVSLWYDSKPVVMGVRFWTEISEYPLENLGPYVGISYGGSIHEVILTVYEFQPYKSFKLKTPIHALKTLKTHLDAGGIPPKGQELNCRVNYIIFERLVVKEIP